MPEIKGQEIQEPGSAEPGSRREWLEERRGLDDVISRLKRLLGEQNVKEALAMECRNAFLAGVADRLHFDEHVLSVPQYEEVCSLIRSLGKDDFERGFERNTGSFVDSVAVARKFCSEVEE